MTLKIGRAGTGAVTLDDPERVSITGDTLSLSGDTYPGTAATMQVLRDELLSLAGNVDEPVVPLIWSEDATLDGFVSVRGVQADYVPSSLPTGYLQWAVELERVSRQGVFEVRDVPVVATNTHSVAGSTYTLGVGADGLGVPTTAILYSSSFNGSVTAVTTGTGALGRTGLDESLFSGARWHQYLVAPAGHYNGSCLIEVNPGGSGTWYPWSGRDLPRDLTAYNVRISNGFLRAGWTATRLQVAAWDGSQWDTAKDYKIGHTSANGWSSVDRVAILRNSPEQVTVRLWIGDTTAWMGQLDITITRGVSHLRARWVAARLGNAGVAMVATSEASTTNTWGLEATSADASGNKFGLWTPTAVTLDTSVGKLTQSGGTLSANGWTFMLSPRIASALYTGYHAYSALAVVSPRQRWVRL